MAAVPRWASLSRLATTPTDPASIAFFRMSFGAIMLWEVWRLVTHNWVDRYWASGELHFTWAWFDWVRPLPHAGFSILFALMAAASVGVLIGYRYRLAAVVLWVGVTYLFLLDKTRFLNHVYLICLIAFLMILIPAHRVWSSDVARGAVERRAIPGLWLWLLRFQVGLPYFFSGIAKINADWLRGEPLRSWIRGDTDFPVFGRFFTEEWVIMAMAYGAILLDLLAVPLLLWRRTRVVAFALLVGFHLVNSRLFPIGVFPWFMILATTVFFDPDWPRRALTDLRHRDTPATVAVIVGAITGAAIGATLPENVTPAEPFFAGVGMAVLFYHLVPSRRDTNEVLTTPVLDAPSRPVMAFLALWVLIQVLFPLRHLAIPGNVSWTEEGHRFSWHMRLRDKESDFAMSAFEPISGERWDVDLDAILTDFQRTRVGGQPDLLVQLAHHIEEVHGLDLVVTVDAMASLNDRPATRFVPADLDLTSIRRPLIPPVPWVLPEPPIPSG